AESLSSLALDQVFTNQVVQEYKPVVFMFSGQGSQYQNMGWGLYQSQPVFKESCDRCFQILEPDLDISLKEILFPSASSTASTLQETQYSQLGIFVIEYALTQLWLTWGVVPEALIGHSIGEYVAATIAGVFSLSDALKIVATRAKLMQQQPPGVMLSVALSAAEMEEYLSEGVCLAVSNAPSLCAVSGEEQAIAKVETALQERGIAARRLKTSHGFHSHLMEQAIAPLTAAIREVNLNPPQIPFISNVTGTWITNEQATNPEYWGQHLRQTVRFAEGIAEIVQEPKRILLEVGAGKTLSTLAQQTSKQQVVISSLRHPKDTQEDLSLILRTCGQLWLAGVKIDWEQLHEVQPYRVALPTYPFERQRYWIEPDLAEFNLPLASKPQTDGDRWFYIPTWSKVLPLAKIDSSKLLQACWLIMEAEPGLEKSLNEYLIAAEQQVINVSQGEDFQVLSDSQIVCNQEHYEQLLAHLNEQNLITQHTLQIIYFQGNFEDANFSNLLNLVKILDKQRLECSIQLNIITQQLHDIIGTENVQIKHSSISGITKVLSQEYPQINCRVIDTDTSQTRVDYLLPEILTSDNLSIAYRGDRRWQQTYQNLTLDSSKTRLKQGGVYLIFGSISKGLGLVWAQYLQEKFQAKLALVGDVEETEGQIDFDNHDYSLIQADINSQADVSKAIATAEEARGKIDGVFYATPMTNQNSASLITELNSSHWEYNYQTKIKPLHVLAACLKDRELDFILLQSSLSSILGGLGLAAYAGANCYLDAFAEEQNNNFDNHTPWFSVNWDAYQTETASQNLSGIGASLSEYSLTPQEVGTATEEILSLPSGSQVIVSKGDLTARIERWLNSTLEEQQAANNISNIQPHARPNLTTEYIPPSNETEKAIAEIWQQVLGIDQVGVNDSFFELGGHSLLAIQTISRIREQFSVELPMSSILADTPTVANLATMIEKQQPQAEELATIEQLLTEVQNMSPEEIAAQLEERNNL
ncbi:MAG: acyltransferase domain-containing protein, partial [Cyanobacteria bacterium J06558_2]